MFGNDGTVALKTPPSIVWTTTLPRPLDGPLKDTLAPTTGPPALTIPEIVTHWLLRGKNSADDWELDAQLAAINAETTRTVGHINTLRKALRRPPSFAADESGDRLVLP